MASDVTSFVSTRAGDEHRSTPEGGHANDLNGADESVTVDLTGHGLGLDLTMPDVAPPAAGPVEGSALAALVPVLERFGLRHLIVGGRRSPRRARVVANAATKRGLDIVVASTALILLSPILLVIAFAVTVSSKGPVIYRQERVGRNGRSFMMLKFRSMVTDAADRVEEMAALAQTGDIGLVDAPAFKSANDPRVTRVGRILRRTSLDEMPQLLNVLRGHMSLVGPRPIEPVEMAALPQHVTAVRQAVRPGLTCLWQVLRYDGMPFRERIELDLLYVQRRTLVLDAALLALTPLALVGGDGAF